jgi:hypothetical protein
LGRKGKSGQPPSGCAVKGAQQGVEFSGLIAELSREESDEINEDRASGCHLGKFLITL